MRVTTGSRRPPAGHGVESVPAAVPRAAAPAARFDAGRVGEERHRNPGWLLAGVLLVLVSAIGGILLFASADDRHDVLVAAADVEVGRPLERSQLRVVQMSSAAGVDTLSTADAASLIGQIAVGPIPAGTLLNRAMFDDELPLGGTEMVFGAALDPGAAPTATIGVGTAVRLVSAPAALAGTPASGPRTPATVLGDGTVWAYEQLGSGKVWVSVRTTEAVGLLASAAAQDDELRVVIVGAGTESADAGADEPEAGGG
jgi:hypothetical protein